MCEGLVAIHAEHIIHMDLKPSNVIFNSATKDVRITDFSVSKRVCAIMHVIYGIFIGLIHLRN